MQQAVDAVQQQINFQHQMNIQHGTGTGPGHGEAGRSWAAPGQGHAGFGGQAAAAPNTFAPPPSFGHTEPMTENARKLAETCRQFVSYGGPGGGGAARGGAPPLSLLQQQVAALQPQQQLQQPQQQQLQQPQQQQLLQQPQQQSWQAAHSAPLRSGLPPSIDPVALRAALACLGGAAARLPASLAADLATAELAPQFAPQLAPELAPQPGDWGGAARDTSLTDGGGLPPEPSTTACDPALSITGETSWADRDAEARRSVIDVEAESAAPAPVPECGSTLGNEDESVGAEPGPIKVQRTE
eukprot:scaffold37178_cov60-Phaeocystis_antarctica.AAC.3